MKGEKLTDLFFRAEPHPQAPKLAPDSDKPALATRGCLRRGIRTQCIGPTSTPSLAAVQRPLRFSCMTTPTTGGVLWRILPSWYLVAEQDRMIVADTQRFMGRAHEGKDPVPMPSITRRSSQLPGLVVDLIREAVQSVCGLKRSLLRPQSKEATG